MKIAFIWQGFSGRYGQWQDGLYAAMKLVEKDNEVGYFDFNKGKIERVVYTSDFAPKGVKSRLMQNIAEFKPDVVLYWEAPVTNKGKDADNWFAVCALPYPKALLFAGGPLKAIDVKDFDLVFVESQINEEDCEREGIPYKRAFGVNTQIMKPMKLEKKYDGFMQATFAGWKRHELFADALQSKGAVAGRKQDQDWNGYDRCVKQKVIIFDEQPAEEVAKLINESHTVVNTSEYWGGGQRCTLESMACGIPPIVMSDSPKNAEFVKASGFGSVVDPDPEAIKLAIKDWENRKDKEYYSLIGSGYVKMNWSEKHYANSLLEGIKSII